MVIPRLSRFGVLITSLLMVLGISSALHPFSIAHADAANATITVDASVTQGDLPRWEKYNVFCGDQGLFGPEDDQLLRNIGQYSIYRSYPNVTIPPLPAGSDNPLLNQMGARADFLMYAFKGSEQEVQDGTISLDTWEQALEFKLKDFKQNSSKFRYVEALNEGSYQAAPGVTPLYGYYDFYKAVYTAVNNVNAALNPDVPLLVGGPVSDSFGGVQSFLDSYVADTNPNKRLDFIDYHTYVFGNESPSAATASQRSTLDGWLTARGLSTNIPAFVTEMGGDDNNGDSGYPQGDIQIAAGQAVEGYYYYNQANTTPFTFCDRKDAQAGFTQVFNGSTKPTYNLMKMRSLLKTTRVSATSDSIDSNGFGVYGVATTDNSGLALLSFNYQGNQRTLTNYSTTLNVNNLPATFSGHSIHLERYLVNSTTSNFDYEQSLSGLQRIEDRILPSATSVSDTVALEPNAITLVILSPIDLDATATSVDDVVQGTGLNQFNYVGSGWGSCSGGTASGCAAGLYGGTSTASTNGGDSATFQFNGPQVALYSQKGPDLGIIQVSVDNSASTTVDLFATEESGNRLVWLSPDLGGGTHTLKVNVTGNKNNKSSNTYGVIDRAVVFGTAQATNTDDSNAGDGDNQFRYFGSWGSCSGGSANGCSDDFYNGTSHSDANTNDFALYTFTGTSVSLYGLKDVDQGQIVVSLVGEGGETIVDDYAASRTANALLWTSPALGAGRHTLKVRINGTKNDASSGFTGVIDRVSFSPYPNA